MPTPPAMTPRDLLLDLYQAAIAAVAPGPAVRAALGKHDPGRAPWLLALGKAAAPMAEAAVAVLAERGDAPAGGLVVAPATLRPPHAALAVAVGDHPEPGDGSFAAAEALGDVVSRIPHGANVLVLLSGGTTSLVGAPEPGVSRAELTALYKLLLGSGLDIAAMNTVRKRFARWGGGKLARALEGRQVLVLIVSDVIGDDLAAIGSGPCVPDPATADDVRRLLERADLLRLLPPALAGRLDDRTGTRKETPKAGEAAFAKVSNVVVASNRLALDAAAGRAAGLGLAAVVHDTLLDGEASAVGASVATALKKYATAPGMQPRLPAALIWGGETTVTLGDLPPGLGGRNQELALAAARSLDGARAELTLLAAGTDGRDGPTDAAGAVVDPGTWRRIAEAGRDPAADLAAHDAYTALDAAGALVRIGLTGTNVMDVVIGLVSAP